METINVVTTNTTGGAKDVHPLGAIPVKPLEIAFKDPEKYQTALVGYEFVLQKWNDINASLKVYQIESMVCDSKLVVSNKVLHWHTGKSYKAIQLENGLIQIV